MYIFIQYSVEHILSYLGCWGILWNGRNE